MECLAWQVACLVLAVALGLLLFKIARLLKSLDKLGEQLGPTGAGACDEVRVYARDGRVVTLARSVNAERQASRLELEAKDEQLGKLNEQLAFFSHDIRTPVAVVQGYMGLLEADEDEAHRQEYLAKMREKLSVMRAMIDELCDYSVILAADEAPLSGDVVVYDVVCSVLADYYGAFVAKGWEPRIEFADETFTARCPEGDLRRVLSNLVGNALKYATACPRFVQRANTLHISNEVDDSCRIDTVRMFERFWRADAARSGEGSGLGLAVARALCDRMGAKIGASVHHDVLDVEVVFPDKGAPAAAPTEGRA